MGRSFAFDFDQDVTSPGRLSSSDALSQLVEGQLVELDIGPKTQPMPVCRTPSIYYCTPSDNTVRLLVECIDYCKDFNRLGLRCIVFRDPTVPPESHIYSWCVTTDGYERETEHYGISGEVLSVKVVDENTPPNFKSTLLSLGPGQLIKLYTEEIPQVHSLPYTPSIAWPDSGSDIDEILVVDWVRDGMIALREPSIPLDSHVYLWYLCTDGVIVQCDVYEPLFKVTRVDVL